MEQKQRKKNEDRMLTAGVVLLCALILFSILVPLFSGRSYSDQDVELQNLGISMSHWFGTDQFGRDLFVRVWYGTGISLQIGLGSMAICGTVGIFLGAVAGYAGGFIDLLLMRAADILDAIPSLLYVILIILTLGANVGSIILGICISGWVEPARIVRGEVMRLKEREFCRASRLAGAGHARILFRHLLPNAAGPIIVTLTFFVPKAIFTEAFLSFVGVGLSAPAASLGTLIQEARSQMRVYPSQMLFPILVLFLLVAALNIIGTGMERKIGLEKK